MKGFSTHYLGVNLRSRANVLLFVGFVATFALNLLVNMFRDVVAAGGDPLNRWLAGICAGVLALCWVVSLCFAPPRYHARPTVIALNDGPSLKRHAKCGMLATVSLYSCSADRAITIETAEGLTGQELWEHLRLPDVQATNMAPLLAGVAANGDELKHLWLIATTDGDKRDDTGKLVAPGSSAILPALTAYLRHLYPEVTVHAGDDYNLSLNSYENIGRAMYELVCDVLEEAESVHGIAPEQFVVDVNGGVLTQSIAAVLANLDHDRDIQVIYTQYNAAHEARGLTPIRFEFSPQTRQTGR